MKIVDESILLFFRVSLSKFSLEALYISWEQRSIYSGVRKECEKSVFPKQGGLATWPNDWTESQVQVAS